MSEAALLSLNDVHRHYGPVRALDGVSLEVGRGETLGVVGESGCGKSTIARLVVGLERPTSGTLAFEGRDYPRSARALRTIRRDIGIVFQDPYDSLDPRFTLQQIVSEPLRAHRRPHDPQRIAQLLASVGMESAGPDSYPGEYSGGQRQRIGIARALALEPELVVCDEPTSALDVSVQAQILNLLLELQGERGLSYLFISHDLEVVRRMSDRVAVIYAGRIVETGPAANVTSEPAHPYTRLLLAAVPATRPAQRRPLAPAGGPVADTAPVVDVAPSLDAAPVLTPAAGCPFAPRCPRRADRCLTEAPQVTPFDDRLVACHFPVSRSEPLVAGAERD